jgi:outer membrane receptor protein involved in Fe transport
MKHHNHSRALSGVLAASIGSLLGGGAFTTAQAQQGSQPVQLEEITVTGTRIRRDDFSTPTPTTVIDDSLMDSLGISNVADMMTQIPSNVSFFQPENTGGSPFFVGSTLANLRGLNPYFGTRTLTLVDSKRHVPTNNGSSVDLNAIPSLLVSRMEIVTGGASAAYGSDAISGVVNILLDRDLEGLKLEADFGTYDGDGDDYRFGVAGGTDIFGGRGHITVGAEFAEQDPILSCADARDWCAEGWHLFSNGGAFQAFGTPYLPTVPGMPQTFFVTDRRINQSSYNGVIFNSGLQATADGSGVMPFQVGLYGIASPFAADVGGDGRRAFEDTTLLPETERSSVMAALSFDFSETLSGTLDVSFANVQGVNLQNDAYFYGVDNYCVAPDNAYIAGNPALQTAVTDNIGNGTFFFCPGQTLVRKDFTKYATRSADTDSDTWRVIAGLDGRIGESTWTWESSLQLGQTKRDQIGRNYPSVYRYQMAIDAVINPATNEPACRVTVEGVSALPAFADPSLIQGCVPINILGDIPLTPEQLAYAWGPIVEYNTIDQDILAGSVSGELWSGFGPGPLVGAFGVEIRNDELQNDVNEEIPAARRVDIAAQYGDAFGGKVDVTEAFIELELPLLANKPGAQQLSINTAYRDATYETTDTDRGQGTSEQDIESWKTSLVWDPTSWLRVRASRSRDVRAAGFRELYWQLTQPAAATGFGAQTNPWLPDLGFPGSQSDPTTLIIAGEVALRPEKADTTTIGVVLTPGGRAEGFRFSADLWEITIKDGIQGGGNAQRVIQNCFINNELCNLITFVDNDPMSPTFRQDMIDVRAPAFNARQYDATGIDFAADYSTDVGAGTLLFRLLTSRALETIVRTPPTTPGGGETVRDISGQVGGPVGFFADWAGSPDFSHNLIVSYARGPFVITAQGQYVSEGRMDLETPKIGPGEPGYDVNLVGSTTNPTVPSHFTANVTGSYRFDSSALENIEVFLSINNVTDRDPKFSSGGVGGAYPVLYPSTGRSFRLGLRMDFF